MNPAGITIRELLRLPILKDAKVISGEQGLDRIVRFIDIMEVPDIKAWLREGELLLTTAYSIRHDLSLLQELVKQLAQAGAAALAIKPERFIHAMPEDMVRMSNSFHLPIIQLPNGTPYMDITHAVMEQIIDKQAALLRRSDEVYRTLTALVLDNSGIQAVADNVAELIKSPIWVIDNTGENIVTSPTSIDHASSQTCSWEIEVDKKPVGKLFIGREFLDDLELVCVEQARLVFSLELMRRKTALDTEMKLRGDFIEELLTGLPLSKQEVEIKGRQLGLKPDWNWEIAIIDAEGHMLEERSPFFLQLREEIDQESQKHKVKSHIQQQGDRFVLLLASQGMPSNEWMERLKAFYSEVEPCSYRIRRKVQHMGSPAELFGS